MTFFTWIAKFLKRLRAPAPERDPETEINPNFVAPPKTEDQEK